MRMKTILAPSMPEAMKMVRAELGDDAVIISTQKVENGQGFRVVAAIEGEEADGGFEPLYTGRPQPRDAIEEVAEALERQGVPGVLAERLLRAASPYAEKLSRAASQMAIDAPVMTLAAALDALFSFKPLPLAQSRRPLMFVGPPGSGKTIAVAKLAARAVLADHAVNIISCDTLRAGGVEQLGAFTRILDIDLQTALDGQQLRDALLAGRINDTGELTLIDTGATNPLDIDQLDDLERLISAAVDCDIVLVLAAGMDSAEAAETAAMFAELGASRLLVTRLDAARRLGALLHAADIGKFALCEASDTPTVADGMRPLNPLTLAQLLLKGRRAPPVTAPAAAPSPPPPAAPSPPSARAATMDLEADIELPPELPPEPPPPPPPRPGVLDLSDLVPRAPEPRRPPARPPAPPTPDEIAEAEQS